MLWRMSSSLIPVGNLSYCLLNNKIRNVGHGETKLSNISDVFTRGQNKQFVQNNECYGNITSALRHPAWRAAFSRKPEWGDLSD